jgi:hypothetical protein
VGRACEPRSLSELVGRPVQTRHERARGQKNLVLEPSIPAGKPHWALCKLGLSEVGNFPMVAQQAADLLAKMHHLKIPHTQSARDEKVRINFFDSRCRPGTKRCGLAPPHDGRCGGLRNRTRSQIRSSGPSKPGRSPSCSIPTALSWNASPTPAGPGSTSWPIHLWLAGHLRCERQKSHRRICRA